MLLLATLVLVVACETTPTPRVEMQANPKPTNQTTPVTPVVARAAQATITPQVPTDEGDCMAGCHIPDPNEEFANGAAPQPPDHNGYKTCVECHIKLAKPVFPVTHTGRMDPACPLCHVLETKAK